MVNLQSLLRIQAVIVGPIFGGVVARELSPHWGYIILGAIIGLILAFLLVETPQKLVGYIARRRLQKASPEEFGSALEKDKHQSEE